MGVKRGNTSIVVRSGVRQLLQPAPQLLCQQPGPGGRLPHQPHGRLQLPGGGVRGPRPRPDMTTTTLKVSTKFRGTQFFRGTQYLEKLPQNVVLAQKQYKHNQKSYSC